MAVTDVRRLVYGLRPPALDELGLIGVLRQSAWGFRHELEIQIVAAELPLLAAAETAAFRIAQDPLNNVKTGFCVRYQLLPLEQQSSAWPSPAA